MAGQTESWGLCLFQADLLGSALFLVSHLRWFESMESIDEIKKPLAFMFGHLERVHIHC